MNRINQRQKNFLDDFFSFFNKKIKHFFVRQCYSPFFALPTRLRDTTKTFEYFFGVRVF
jgi:hypothetical protein